METCEKETSASMVMQQQKLNTHKGRRHNGHMTHHRGKNMRCDQKIWWMF